MTYEEVSKIHKLMCVYDRKLIKETRVNVLFKFTCYLEEIICNYLKVPKRSTCSKSVTEWLEDIKYWYSFYMNHAREYPERLKEWELMEILLAEAIEETDFDLFVPELYELIRNDCLMTTDLKVTLMKLSKTHIDNERFEL